MNYNEYIDQLKPCPRFNLKWYKGEDLYSDGDVEDEIIRMIAENPLSDYDRAVTMNMRWATFYHLSHVRENLLNWYPFYKDASVLEIGCGFGAITNLLCEKNAFVTAVEMSKRRAAGALLRCRDRENLEIIVGNLNDIEFEKKYDIITLIGVLEYQGLFSETETPYMDFLKKIKTLLAPGGKLLIAIENQYGIKYWCGAAEDHTGRPYDGIRQYEDAPLGVRTFSRKRLQKMLDESGFHKQLFYYPQPDYKLPDAIFSEEYIPDSLADSDVNFYYLQNRKSLNANERSLYPDLVENGVFEFFANSFLVECCENERAAVSPHVIYAKCNSLRNVDYRMITRIYSDHVVEKIPATTEAEFHLQEILENTKRLRKAGIRILGYEMCEGPVLRSEYYQGTRLESVLQEAKERGRKDVLIKFFDMIKRDVLSSSEPAEEGECLLCELGLVDEEYVFSNILRWCSIDMIPRNAFVQDDEIVWYDQEWVLENVPADFVLYRAITNTFGSKDEDAEALLRYYGIEGKKREIYKAFYSFFTGMVADADYVSARRCF